MKKVLLSSFVILTFVLYSVHKQLDGTQPINIVAPANTTPTSQNNQPSQQSNQQSSIFSSPSPTPTTNMNGAMKQNMMGYKDGQYTGNAADAYYGNIQVKVIISGGKITDVVFLDYPHDRGTSIEINSQAMPYLKQEAIQVQNANVDIISGATDSSLAFRQSLQTALNQAK